MRTLGLLFTLLASSFAVSVSNGEEARRQYLGAFSNVRISEMSGDCGGVSVQLWLDQQASGKKSVSGVFYDASGVCPGSRSDIAGASIDAHSGRLDFTAKDRATGVVVAEFRGVLGASGLRGRLGFGNRADGTVDSWSEIELNRLTAKEWAAVSR